MRGLILCVPFVYCVYLYIGGDDFNDGLNMIPSFESGSSSNKNKLSSPDERNALIDSSFGGSNNSTYGARSWMARGSSGEGSSGVVSTSIAATSSSTAAATTTITTTKVATASSTNSKNDDDLNFFNFLEDDDNFR